jgi:MFS family permease
MAARAALGIAEGGLFPGVTFYITMWYRRHECGFRMAIFFSAATAAGAFGGLLARGITEMDELGGLAGWAWIFILEGLITFIVGMCSRCSRGYPFSRSNVLTRGQPSSHSSACTTIHRPRNS